MKKTILSAILMFIMALNAQAQIITVQGTVLSKTDGEPLIGATVIPVSDASAGVATDFDGNFTLNIAQGAKLTLPSRQSLK